jgi:lantibiotic transport system permease protein
MSLLLSFRSELIKTKRTSSVYLCIIVATLAAFIPLTMLTDPSPVGKLKNDLWNQYYLEGVKGLHFVLLTMYITLIATLLPQIEYRNNTWKQLLASPQPIRNIFVSKFLVIHLLILLFFIVYNLLMGLTAFAFHFLKPGFHFSEHSFNWNKWILSNFKTYLSIFAISAVQFWMGMRYKNFIAPIGIGLVLWMAAGVMVFEFHWEHAEFFPHAYPVLSLLSVINKPEIILFGIYEWASIGYAVFFLLLAFVDFNKKGAKA